MCPSVNKEEVEETPMDGKKSRVSKEKKVDTDRLESAIYTRLIRGN